MNSSRFHYWISFGLVCAIACANAKGPAKETTDAIAALQKIKAATQVGVNYQTYGQLLIEAKAKVNDAMKSLPDGQLKTEISGAMDAYADAATVWGMKIKGERLHPEILNSDEAFVAKYLIPAPKNESVDMEKAMQIIWLRADIHLNQIDTLLKQSGK